MKHTIVKLESIIDNLQGYAFIDEYGHTIIQVYGEKKLNFITKKLNDGLKTTNPTASY